MSKATVAHFDLETRATVDLRKVGHYAYFDHPDTQIILMSWRIGDGPTHQWRPGFPDPGPLLAHALAGGTMTGHNQPFDRQGWNTKAPAHWPKLTIEQSDCTMSRALAIGLPAGLDNLGAVLDAPVQKDKDGHRLMMQMCRPRSLEPLTWWDDDDRIERLQAYCDQDVASECAVDKLLPALSERERRVWELDQRINDRGVAIDLPLVRLAIEATTEAAKRADREIWVLTDGAVKRCTETAKIVAWINSRGIQCTSVAKGEIDDLVLPGDIMDDPTVVKVVRLRRATARSSTAKYKALEATACADGRVRGTIAYHKAHTGRWAGSGAQFQNFPRVDNPDAVEEALELLGVARSPGDAVDSIDLMVGPPMEILSKALRSMGIAPPGKKLVGGDFKNIEGRICAWLAGEEWKLQAFRDFDAGTGPDLYRIMAADVLGIDIEQVTPVDRQVRGKVPELACQFQGALGAFQKMAYTQDPPVYVTDSEAMRIVRAWREKNSAIVQSWYELQDAAIGAVGAPGCVLACLHNRVQYVVAQGFLFCKLPSERVIAYARPRLLWVETAVMQDGSRRPLSEIEPTDPDRALIERIEDKRSVSYRGVDSFTKKWSPQYLYGGSQTNHVVQGSARDVLVDAMFDLEDAGYPIVLTVHDDVMAETDEDFGSAEAFGAIMAREKSWRRGLPLTVSTWEGMRWSK